jgi:serine phosphatase RsbU (regulator of sigma subunit)
VQRALPAAVLLLVTAVDLLSGRGQVVLGLVVIAPLVAATALGRRATLFYGVLAGVIAALLGVYDEQYTRDTIVAQTFRLFGVAAGAVLAVGACTLRINREQHLDRLRRQAAVNEAALQMAEALQVSLLGPPPRVSGLQTAARYLPAVRHAQVGGDWYDAFALPDGTTMLVIGDVAGHDAPAAATMAQVRGMVRAIASSTGGSPATVLSTLDQVLIDLDVGTLVTVLVGIVEVDVDGTGTLSWSNAGHPPPVLVCADGRTQFLERVPERLLGIGPDAPRTDHEVPLHPRDTLFLYTDGLIERRTVPLDDGFAWLLEELRTRGRRPLDQLCDELLAELGGRVDDDVALLAVRLPGAQPGLR